MRAALATALGVAGGVAGACLLFVYLRHDAALAHRPFEREIWLRARISTDDDVYGHTLRQQMSRDLVAEHLAPAMTRTEVRTLLGAPSAWPLFLGAAWFGPEDEAWWLGRRNGLFAFDDEWLYLDFGDDDRLLRGKILGAHVSRRRAP